MKLFVLRVMGMEPIEFIYTNKESGSLIKVVCSKLFGDV
jgi:hypothetical protein